MFNSISFYSFIENSTIYVDVFLKINLGLIKLIGIAFLGISVTVHFLIILLLLKQTIPTKKQLTKQRKYKNGAKANLAFYTLRHSLLIIFKVLKILIQAHSFNINNNKRSFIFF